MNAAQSWDLSEDGVVYCKGFVGTEEQALAEARSNVDRVNYPDAEGTLWIDVGAYCEETGEHARDTVTLEPEEPECSGAGGHDWQSPIEIVGGIESNPGVWSSNGGGVIIVECCMQCGCKRTTDTFAQRPDTGERGFHSVSYEEGAFADEIQEVLR